MRLPRVCLWICPQVVSEVVVPAAPPVSRVAPKPSMASALASYPEEARVFVVNGDSLSVAFACEDAGLRCVCSCVFLRVRVPRCIDVFVCVRVCVCAGRWY